MQTFLICPGERAAVGFLAQTVPLVAVPILGESLVNCWIESLAGAGAKEIVVLATDRPELVRAAVGDGSRWGVRVQVQAVLHEPQAQDVAARQASDSAGDVIAMECLPGFPGLPLFRSYRDWFAAVCAWMARVPRLPRIGVRELGPQVSAGLRTQVAPSAILRPPCWLGEHVRVGPNAVIGPNAILEDRVIVDAAAEIQSSVVGPDTFVGALTRVEGSIAWGNTLIDWRNGSCTQVPDPFLLCALGQRYLRPAQGLPAGRFGRGLLSWLARPWSFRPQISKLRP